MNSILHTPFASIEVTRLSRSEWRVSDAADSERLLGYIERQRPGRFEVLWMTDPMRWGYASSLDDAFVAFGDSARFTGEILLERAAESSSRSHASVASNRGTTPRRSTWLNPDDDFTAA